jgi:sensor histidine kinase YesM
MTGQSELFIFSDKWRYRVSRHIAFWFAWLVFHGIIYGSFWRGGDGPFGEGMGSAFFVSFSEALIFMPAHIFLSYAIIYYLLPRFLFKRQYLKLVVGLLFFLILTALFSHLISITLISEFRRVAGVGGHTNPLLFGLMAGLRGSNTVAGFAAAIKLIKFWYLKNEESQKLEKEKIQAELLALRNQLHPHFLFNTLNSLYSLTLQQSKQAPNAVERLSDLLRYILTESNKSVVPLKAELSLLRSYIELEKIRIGERLQISFVQQGNIEAFEIAPLLLLPFVENAFKHGVRNQLDPVWITLRAEMEEETFLFQIVNGKSENSDPITSTGIGLQNIQKRLELLYADRFQLKLTDEGDLFIVTLKVELNRKTEEDVVHKLELAV